MNSESLLATGLIPDGVVRYFIRRRLAQKLSEEKNAGDSRRRIQAWTEDLKNGPIAIHTQDANAQHYELPPEFFQYALGSHLKYSSGYWNSGVTDLEISEKDMLELYLQRGKFQDGQNILELGCGWGSLSLYLAARFPSSKILGISNSRPQREFIEARARKRGLSNLTIQTADINQLELSGGYDRIVSIEMFEHMRNYERLLEKVAGWLKPEGLVFIHIFCHRLYAYPFENKSPQDWMGRYFFTGGMMPSFNFFDFFPKHLCVHQSWEVSGIHYQKTSNAWLAQMDRNRAKIEPVFQKTYGEDWKKWWVYWRVFFMACAELFGYENGKQWEVGHYLLKKVDLA